MKSQIAMIVSAVAPAVAVLTYVAEYLFYLLNKSFILANIEALPFKYQIALGFAQFEWWAIVICILLGIVASFGVVVEIYK